jgi:hypothetical protein
MAAFGCAVNRTAHDTQDARQQHGADPERPCILRGFHGLWSAAAKAAFESGRLQIRKKAQFKEGR